MFELSHWLENHMAPCLLKQLSGIDCPGCGIQRSFVELLKGNFIASIKIYPPLLFIIFCIFLTATHLLIKFKNGANYIKYACFTTMSIVLLNYIIKY